MGYYFIFMVFDLIEDAFEKVAIVAAFQEVLNNGSIEQHVLDNAFGY